MVDKRKLEDVSRHIGEAVLDPQQWSTLMEDICKAVGATGAAMLQSDIRTEDIPRTASVAEFFDKGYFQNNLHVGDVRAKRGVPLLLTRTNVVTDADLFRSETEMLRDPLYAALGEWGLKWFAAVGFRAGPALWGLTIQRTPQQGMFDGDEVAILSQLSSRLTEAATLSTAVGRTAIASLTNALDLMERPALAIDRRGGLLGINNKAETYLGRELVVRGGRLSLTDKDANTELIRRTDQLRLMSDLQAARLSPVVINRTSRRPLVLQLLPVPPAARSPFLGARAILVLKDLERSATFSQELIVKLFNLTPAQARLGIRVANGASLEEAAAELGVALETARNHLKAIFAKTDTHRQGELIALLNKIAK
ncbi:helix-turn-helix transcriptional regulator [Bradyrhizobium manausense]|uniref:helix-turn-helix transcriptional regulator n=1 Tax=Bradyrhizobium manausense TaxID=989370 RepID=UPI001BA65A82|nr:helix-turn-helix transcriptional regulator [Bradyrhizobium manausense]MBR0827086.1 helix-turn-helix transcriptional regulator [Bradyrhizobium manausense]